MRFKKILSIMTAVTMTFMTVTFTTSADEHSTDDGEIIIYHTNDVHGYFEGADGVVGHDLIAGIVESEKATHPATYLVSAGDMIQGNFFVNNNRGEAAAEIMSASGYDALTLGNHEFDYGTERILELRTMFETPVFMTQAGFEGIRWSEPQLLEKGGVKVGFFGITTPETVRSSTGGRDVDFGTYETVVAYANDSAETLRDQGAEIVICVAHYGIFDDGFGDIYDLRDSTDGIDLFIDGHSHTPLEDYEAAEPPIVSAGEYAAGLGKVTFTPDGEGGYDVKAESLTPEIANSLTLNETGASKKADVAAVITKWSEHAVEIGKTVLVQNENAMTAVREELRTGETVIGDFVADAMKASSGADIAFMNGGSIRADLPAGDITIADINSTLPFVNFILSAKMTGADVLAILEHSLSYYPDQSGGFLQVSGVSFTFDPSAEPGNRITEISVNGVPLDPAAEYTVATNDWIAGGGDDYTMNPVLFQNTLPLAHPENTSLTDAVTWYMGTNPAIPSGVGRIIMATSNTAVEQMPTVPSPNTGNTPMAVTLVFIAISATGLVLSRKKR